MKLSKVHREIVNRGVSIGHHRCWVAATITGGKRVAGVESAKPQHWGVADSATGTRGWVRIMPRLPADVRISLKKRGQRTFKIELIRQRLGQRFWVRRDGKRSQRVPETSATEIAERG